MVRDQLANVYSEDDFESVKSEVRTMRKSFLSRFLFPDNDYDENYHFDEDRLGEIIEENIHKKDLKLQNRIKTLDHQTSDINQMEKEIEELFKGSYTTEDAREILLKKAPF